MWGFYGIKVWRFYGKNQENKLIFGTSPFRVFKCVYMGRLSNFPHETFPEEISNTLEISTCLKSHSGKIYNFSQKK